MKPALPPRLPLGLACAAALSMTTALATGAWAAGMVNVDQKGLAFSAPALTVKKGVVLNFSNSDTTSHNILITGAGVSLNSGLQQPGVSFKAPMVKPGTYQVMCGIHPKMKMTVTVN
ncbi:MAG TPA: cupredoxin domain-containing protein [Caulobacter sp.]|nr:cupredoxin domain-containing protein [Caulobacter sp.]